MFNLVTLSPGRRPWLMPPTLKGLGADGIVFASFMITASVALLPDYLNSREEDPAMSVDVRRSSSVPTFRTPRPPPPPMPSLARALKARLYLHHVVPEEDVRVLTAIRAYLQSEVTPETLVDTFPTEAAKRLATLVEEAHATDLVPGQPCHRRRRRQSLSWAAARQSAAHHPSGPTDAVGPRFLMGSVAERVLREAPCAVLVVPSTAAVSAEAGPAARSMAPSDGDTLSLGWTGCHRVALPP